MKISISALCVALIASSSLSAQDTIAGFLFENLENMIQSEDFSFDRFYRDRPEGGEPVLYMAPLAFSAPNDSSSAMIGYKLKTPASLLEIGARDQINFHCSQKTTRYPESFGGGRPFDLLIDHLDSNYLHQKYHDFTAFRNCEATVYFSGADPEKSQAEPLFELGNEFMAQYFGLEHFRMDVNQPNFRHACVVGEILTGEACMVTWEVRDHHSLHISILAPISGEIDPLDAIEFVEKPRRSL